MSSGMSVRPWVIGVTIFRTCSASNEASSVLPGRVRHSKALSMMASEDL